MLELKDFEAAYNKVQEVVLPTKLIKSEYFSDQTGNDVYLKPENMQLTGAYKIRGAYYKISTLSEEEEMFMMKHVHMLMNWLRSMDIPLSILLMI